MAAATVPVPSAKGATSSPDGYALLVDGRTDQPVPDAAASWGFAPTWQGTQKIASVYDAETETVHATWRGWYRRLTSPAIIDVWMDADKNYWFSIFAVGADGQRGNLLYALATPIRLFICDLRI